MKVLATFLILSLFTIHCSSQLNMFKRGDVYICQNADGSILFNDQDSLKRSATPYDKLFLSAKNGLFTVYKFDRKEGRATIISDPKYTQYYYNLDITGPHIVMIDSVGMKYKYFFDGGDIEMSSDVENTGLNTAGKYGLFNNGNEILTYQFDDLHDAYPTGYDYTKPTWEHLGIYEAQEDSGKVYYDKNGNLLYSKAVDYIIPFDKYPGTFGVQKGEKFGFFSEDNSYYSPLISYQDIPRRFQTYGVKSYSDLSKPFVVSNGDKRKVIDLNQNEILPPIFEKAFIVNNHKYALTFKDNQWSVLSLKTKQVVQTMDIDLWIGESYSNRKMTGFYVLDGKVKGVNFKSFREVKNFDFVNDSKVTAFPTAENLNLAFDTQGNIIIPAGRYKDVAKCSMRETNWFIVTNADDKVGIIDFSGTIVIDFEYELIDVSYNPRNHLILTKNGFSAIAIWQENDPYLKTITEFEYRDLMFLGYDKYILATGTNKSGQKCSIYKNGTVKVIE